MTEAGLRQRLAAHSALRLIVATVLLLGLAATVPVRWAGVPAANPFIALIGVTFGATIALLALPRFGITRAWLPDLHFALDVVLVSVVVLLTGGINSLFTTLYALPVLSASVIPGRRRGLRMAALAAVLFVGLVVAQYAATAGRMAWPVDVDAPSNLPPLSVALYTLGLNVFGIFAVAMLAGSLAERARTADVRLERVTEQIADLQAFNQYIIDSLLSGLATADAGGRLLTFNRSAMAITGIGPVSPAGRLAAEVLQLPHGVLDTIDADLKQVRSKRMDYRFVRPDGSVIDLGLSVAGLRLPDGSRGYIYTFQDVTETKRFERNARMQQRLAAVGEMAAGIAHEIRNPLASMSGSMQMLRHELDLSGDQAQLMDIVLRESERLNETIKSFLAYARPAKAQRSALDLGTLVKETAMLLRNSPDVGERHHVRVSVPGGAVPIAGDEGQIRQILWNLATNGLRAMPDGGELELVARTHTANGGEAVSVLDVIDHGVGMSAEELEGIFQPFRGSFGKGTGLGLAIVHRIVTDSGGRIDVHSEPERGTTFTVRFPRASLPAHSA